MDPNVKKYLLDLAQWRLDVLAWADAQTAQALGIASLDSGNNGPPPPPPTRG